MRTGSAPLWACFFLLGCASLACAPTSSADAGVHDAGPNDTRDAGVDAGSDLDAGDTQDAGEDPLDDAGAARDGGPLPAPGFGAISGPCGVLDDELSAPEPFFFANAIDFGADPYDDEDYALLSPGGQQMIDEGNAGGSSLLSEVFAYEVLFRCEGAALIKTENYVLYYDPQGKITDLLVHIDDIPIGVSVTRAVAFPFDDPYTVEQARHILEQKLEGVLASTANVKPADAWQKQILSVIAYGEGHVSALEEAYALIDEELKADTIVYVTVSNGDDAFLY